MTQMNGYSPRVARFWKLVDDLDEWGHRHGYGSVNGHVRAAWFWRLTPFPFICDLKDAKFGAPLTQTNFPNTGTMTLKFLRWKFHDDRPRNKVA